MKKLTVKQMILVQCHTACLTIKNKTKIKNTTYQSKCLPPVLYKH